MKSPLATCLSHLKSYRQHYILKSKESMPCFPEVQIRADVQTTCGFLMTTCLLQVTHYVSEFPPPQSLILKECVYSQGTNFKYRKAKTMKVKCHMWNYTNSDRNSFQMIYTMDYSILHGFWDLTCLYSWSKMSCAINKPLSSGKICSISTVFTALFCSCLSSTL